jgi:anion-transporting  ArsA/GET3 family ATPase
MKTGNTNKRIVFTMGDKGGVGKTGLMVALAEWSKRTRFRSRC